MWLAADSLRRSLPVAPLVLALMFAGQAAAATVTVRPDAESIDLSDSLDYRVAPSRLEVAEVAAEPQAFYAVGRNQLNRGFSRDAHWLRVTLANPSDAPMTRWLEIGHPRLQSVRLFWREGGAWRALAAGTQVPRVGKPVVAATPAFPLTLAPHEERALYVRVASETVIDMGATLWDPLTFRGSETTYFLGRGAFLAALLLASGFALMIWLLMRDRTYLLFGLALLFQTGFEACMSGVIQRYLWPAPWPFATTLITVCSGTALVFHALFLRNFLDLRRTLPLWNHVLVALAGLGAACALGGFYDFGLWARIAVLDAIAITVVASIVSLVLLHRGYRPARFLLAGLSLLWGAVLLSQAMILGLLPIWAPALNGVPPATVVASTLILLAISEHSRELRDNLARTYAVHEAKTNFLAHMSHELRTPLNTVIGFARLLQKGTAHMSPQESGHAIERSGLHLLSMIDELLDHARGELGQLRLAPAPTIWADFIDANAGAAHMMTQSMGNRFLLDAGGTFPVAVMIDGRRLRQVLENLLANANRHTQAGDVTLVCRAEPATGPGNVRMLFCVTDTGEGVMPDDVERIFEPFQRGARTKTESNAQGVGLGLAIARQLVALMGGTLQLENTSPRGSTFSFAIECAALDIAGGTAATDANAPLAQSGRRRTLLVAEDDTESRTLLANLLRTAGFAVIEAASGREALARLGSARLGSEIDLVLTDQFMPDGDGWEVLRGVRACAPSLRVVLISAAEPHRPPEFPDGLEFDGTLDKPLEEEQLFGLIVKFLAIELETMAASASDHRPFDGIKPPARYRAELAKLVAEGRITDINEWTQLLAAESPAWAGYANRVKEVVRRLDFGELTRLVADDAAIS